MKANETKLQPLLEGEKQFVVPMFQRSYSWTKKEWETLWNDLIELSESDMERDHFMGSMVTMPAHSVPEGVTKYLLIDGQQRITTVFVLLAALRDHISSEAAKLSEQIHNTFLVNPYIDNENDHYKLLPTQADRMDYKTIIEGNIEIASNHLLAHAYQFFRTKFKRGVIDAQTLKSLITQHVSVVSIVLENDDNPYSVFESLNAKGMPLSQSDLIRNFFFMKIHVDQHENIHSSYWRPMEDELSSNLTEYIRHFLMKDGTFVRTNEVYLALKDAVGASDPIEYLKMLAKSSSYYSRLLDPGKEGDSELRKALIRINRIEVNTAYPFLLNCYNAYDSGTINRDELLNTIATIENFTIRRFVCAVPTNQLNKIFPPLFSQAIKESGDNFPQQVKTVLQKRGYPKDHEFRTRLLSTKLYGSGDRQRKIKLILETIEESFGHKETVSFDDLQVEHVMPQTLTDWWQNHLGEDWENTYDLLLHTLGNLTLTAYNPELSNEDFFTKRSKFQNSHLEINKYFIDQNSWSKKEIEHRALELADRCLSIWPYFGDETMISDNFDVTGTVPNTLWILGQSFSVHSWRDVLENTLNTVAELEPDRFEILLRDFPRFVSRDPIKYKATRKLINGTYAEVNLSAASIQRFCIQVMDVLELTSEDWRVEAT